MPVVCRQYRDPDEIDALGLRIDAGFGVAPSIETEPETDPLQPLFAAARIDELTLGVEDDDRIVGGCFGLAVDFTLPGGTAVAVAGLAGVGIDPSMTGRGALSAMMRMHLAEAKNLGLPASVLYASEAGLYGRYGYGQASTVCHYEAVSAYSQLATPHLDTGEVRLGFDAAAIKSEVRAVHDSYATKVGMTSRSDALWKIYFHKKESWLGGGVRSFVVHYNADGRPDGYAAYKVKGDQVGHALTQSRAMVTEFVCTTVEAELALWDYLIRLPLTRFVELEHAPAELAVTHYMRDARQLRQVKRVDCLWLRPLDVERLLTKRGYESDGTASFDLRDPQFDDLSGTYTVTVSDGTATVVRGGEPSGVVLTPAQLGAILSGAQRAGALARAAVIDGPVEAVQRLDQIFAIGEVPFTLTRF